MVNLASLWAGPLTGQLLHRLGAQVTKVESIGRPDGGRRHPEFFDQLHAGADFVTVDWSTDAGRARLRELLESADVVIEGSRPWALEQLGIDARAVVRHGPQVWVSITGHGRDGEHAMRVGFGDDAAAAGGLVDWIDGTPRFVGDAVADPLAGLTAAVAVVDALEAGGRVLLDVALFAGGRLGGGADPAQLTPMQLTPMQLTPMQLTPMQYGDGQAGPTPGGWGQGRSRLVELIAASDVRRRRRRIGGRRPGAARIGGRRIGRRRVGRVVGRVGTARTTPPARCGVVALSSGVVALSSGVVSAGSVVAGSVVAGSVVAVSVVAVSTADTAIAAGTSVGATSPAAAAAPPMPSTPANAASVVRRLVEDFMRHVLSLWLSRARSAKSPNLATAGAAPANRQ